MRQLNFYCFRKIKSDPVRLTDVVTEESNYQKFKHDKFQKNRPELLLQIRKSNHTTESADKQEVEVLKREVKDLRKDVASLTDGIIKLKTLIGSLLKNQQLQQENEYLADLPEAPIKKRKLTNIQYDEPLPVFSEGACNVEGPMLDSSVAPLKVGLDVIYTEEPRQPYSLEPINDTVYTPFPVQSGHTEKNDTSQSELSVPAIPLPKRLSERNQSFTTTASLDHDVLASLFAIESSDDFSIFDDHNSPDALISLNDDSNEIEMDKNMFDAKVDPQLIQRLRNALSSLPPAIQSMFVDRLTAVISDPEALSKQVEAMTKLAALSANEAQRRLIAAGHDPNDKHFLPLASAVLGAYLARFMEQNAAAKTKNLSMSEI